MPVLSTLTNITDCRKDIVPGKLYIFDPELAKKLMKIVIVAALEEETGASGEVLRFMVIYTSSSNSSEYKLFDMVTLQGKLLKPFRGEVVLISK